MGKPVDDDGHYSDADEDHLEDDGPQTELKDSGSSRIRSSIFTVTPLVPRSASSSPHTNYAAASSDIALMRTQDELRRAVSERDRALRSRERARDGRSQARRELRERQAAHDKVIDDIAKDLEDAEPSARVKFPRAVWVLFTLSLCCFFVAAAQVLLGRTAVAEVALQQAAAEVAASGPTCFELLRLRVCWERLSM
jgi:hypothetical protein